MRHPLITCSKQFTVHTVHWWKYIFVQQVLSTNIEVLMSKKLESKDIESKKMKTLQEKQQIEE